MDWIKKSSDLEPILIATGVILIIVGLTIMAMGIVWGYAVLGIGIIMIAAKVLGYFKESEND